MLKVPGSRRGPTLRPWCSAARAPNTAATSTGRECRERHGHAVSTASGLSAPWLLLLVIMVGLWFGHAVSTASGLSAPRPLLLVIMVAGLWFGACGGLRRTHEGYGTEVISGAAKWKDWVGPRNACMSALSGVDSIASLDAAPSRAS